MTVADILSQYPEKTWILVKVTKESERNEILEGEVVFASTDRDEVYTKIADVEDSTHVATLYTGPIMEEGKAFAFYAAASANL